MKGRSIVWPLIGLLLLGLLLRLGDRLPAAERGTFAFDPPPGSYEGTIRVALRPARSGDPLVYAFGGVVPTATVGLRYRAPIPLAVEGPTIVILRAREFEGMSSTLHTAVYRLGMHSSLPTLVLAAEPEALTAPDHGILTRPDPDLELPVEAALFAADGSLEARTTVGLRLLGFSEGKPSFRLHFRRRYDEAGSASRFFEERGAVGQHLMLDGGDAGRCLTLIDEALLAESAADLGLTAPRSRFLLLFLNDEPWGLYLLRERLDRSFLERRLGLTDADLIRGHKARAGVADGWLALLDEAEGRDPAAEAFYPWLDRQVDIEGLMDAVLLHEATGRGRILAWRPHREGARWQWLIDPAGTMDDDEAVLRLHRRLMANPRYRARFEALAAQRLGGPLSGERLLARYDALAADLRAEIGWEVGRRPFPPGVYGDARQMWEAGLQDHREALRARLASLAARYGTGTASAPPRAAPEAPRPNDVVINEYWMDDNGTPYASLGGRGIVGDWIELRTRRPHLDLRRWRLTDNDRKESTAEGSLILPDLPALADLPRGTIILIIATENITNSRTFPADDLDGEDGRLLLYAGNGHLDRDTDPGFALDTHREALILLAPGDDNRFEDDIGIDFIAEGSEVTPRSFGIAGDGVRFTEPFRGIGRDDGAILTGESSNDDGRVAWIVDPPPTLTGDREKGQRVNILSPGAPNEGQQAASGHLWLILILVPVALLTAANFRHH